MCPNRLGGMMQPAKTAHGAFLAHPSWGPRKAGRLCGERRSSVVIELSCLHGSERYAACFDEVVARAVRVSQPAVLSALLAIQLFGIVVPPPIFPLKSTKRSAAAISRSQRSFITFYGALRNILLSAGFPAMFHMIALEQTFVNCSLQKFFLLLLPFQIESILSVICLSFLRWIFQRWKIQFRKKRIAVFSHPPIRPMPHPHLQTSPDYCFSRAE